MSTGPADAAPKEPLLHGQGLLWKIEGAASAPSYLFGTVHLGGKVLNLPAPVRQAFDWAQSASFEILMDQSSSERFASMMFTSGRRSLDSLIGPDLYSDVVDLAEPYGLTVHQVRHLKPWTLLFLFSKPPGQSTIAGDSEPFLDFWLYEQAVEQGKAVYGLETIAEHVDTFDGMSKRTQRKLVSALVRWRLEQAVDIEAVLDEVVRLYLARDIEGIFDMDGFYGDRLEPEVEEIYRERLLDIRNHLMVRRMLDRLEEGNAFVAVGAGHLPGEEGIVNLLIQKGYKLTRVY